MSFNDVMYGPLGSVNQGFQNNLAQNTAGMNYSNNLVNSWQNVPQVSQSQLYGGGSFGAQPAYYAGLGAAYGRATGGFGTPGSNPGWQDPQPPDQPSPWAGTGFDPTPYLRDNPDVAAATGGDPMRAFEHARTYGVEEGRAGTEGLTRVYINAPPAAPPPNTMPNLPSSFSPLNSYQGGGYNAFNPAIYGGAAMPNLGGKQPTASTPTQNFNTFDSGQGLENIGVPQGNFPRPRENFDDWFNKNTGGDGGWGSYYERNPDVKAAAEASGRGWDAFAQEHANQYGGPEGRQLFDSVKYLQENPDVAKAGMGGWQHYNQFGRNEGREADWGNIFDKATYLRENPDVQSANMDAMQHYLLYGEKEGRKGGIVPQNSRDELARAMTAGNQPVMNPSYFNPGTYAGSQGNYGIPYKGMPQPGDIGFSKQSPMPNIGYNPGMANSFANPGMNANSFQNRFGMGFPNAGTPSQVIPDYGHSLTSMDIYNNPQNPFGNNSQAGG